MRIYKTEEVLTELELSIINKKPFSLIRFGDGGIKFLHSIYYHDEKQLEDIIEREGLPGDRIPQFLTILGKYSRQANFIDTPEIYFTDYFWDKCKRGNKKVTKKTINRMKMWVDLYSRAEFDNDRFCNPEANYLMCTRIRTVKRNLLEIMKNRKICCISTWKSVPPLMKKYNIDIVNVCSHYENQYETSFTDVVTYIKKYINKYDLWLVAAGELGRIYSGLIKELNGVAVDIGFVIDYWETGMIPDRLLNFIQVCEKNPIEFELTDLGKTYEDHL